MSGFLKKVFSFGKKEVIERPAEDEALAPINWDALKELRGERAAPVETLEAIATEPAIGPTEPQASPPFYPETPGPELPTDLPPEPELQDETPEPLVSDELQPHPEFPVGAPREPDDAPEPEVMPQPPAPDPPEPTRPAPLPEEPRFPEPPAPDLPVEVPAEPEAPPMAPPAEVPADLPPEPALPVEVPPEPKPDTRPTPEVPAERERPQRELPEREIQAPEVPVEIPLEPQPAVEVPVGPAKEPSPEPDRTEPEQPIELPVEPAPEPRPVPEVPIEIPEPPRPVAPAAQPLARKPHEDDLGPINWDALKAFRRQDEPPPVEPTTKVTVAKKVEQKTAPVAPAPPAPRVSWYQRLREGLARSSKELSSNIAGVFTKRKLDEDTLQDLEDVLLRADLGMETAIRVTDTLASTRYGKEISDAEVRAVMASEIEKVLTPVAQALELDLSHRPHVILVVGVNGTGKTTTIGKLAAKLKEGGLSVMLAAGDTFRAAAIEQLKIWGERTDSPVISSKLGADAAGLAFDAFVQAREVGTDVLIIDTAGRLQNKTELMAELEKIVRVLNKHDPEAPHTVLQTIDATTGQNALNQVEIFRNVAGVNGLVLTKLDGTARGGILVAIAAKHKLPVYFIGVGEQVDDLEPFQARDFARAIAGVA